MASQLFGDYSATTLVTTASAGATTLNVASNSGFPTIVTPGDYFYATLVDATSAASGVAPPAQREVVKVTANSTTTWSVVRGQGGTAAQQFLAGAAAQLRFAAQSARDMQAAAVVGPQLGWFNVKTFGAIGDGTTNDTAAFVAAFAAAINGCVYVPTGNYLITPGVLNISSAMAMFGDGMASSNIGCSAATGDLITVSAAEVQITGIRFTSVPPRTAGALIKITGSKVRIWGCWFDQYFEGISTAGTTVEIAHCIFILGAPSISTGIKITGGIDVRLHDLLMQAPSPQGVANINIIETGDVSITSCNILGGAVGMLVNPGVGQVAASINIASCFFDNCTTRGLDMVPTGGGSIVRCRFVKCWFSSSATNDGARITGSGVDGVEFVGCEFYLNATNGAAVLAGAKNIRFIGGGTAQNAQAGIFTDAVSEFAIIGMRSGDGNGLTGNGTYGVVVNTAGQNNFQITDCDLRGNGTAPMLFNSTGTSTVLANNIPLSLNVARISTAANGRMGQATLTAGGVTVNTTAITASSYIFISRLDDNSTPLGQLSIATITPGVGFSIGSDAVGDESTVAWMLIEPAP